MKKRVIHAGNRRSIGISDMIEAMHALWMASSEPMRQRAVLKSVTIRKREEDKINHTFSERPEKS